MYKRNHTVGQIELMANAIMRGSEKFSGIRGDVAFKQLKKGVLVTAEISGLPNNADKCDNGVFGFHIHEGTDCNGNEKDPFANSKMHYNPNGYPHPFHAGDLPPLFGNNGFAYMSVFTDRFKLEEVIGRVVIIHSKPDDFTTQPNGNSGMKIACGKIVRIN